MEGDKRDTRGRQEIDKRETRVRQEGDSNKLISLSNVII